MIGRLFSSSDAWHATSSHSHKEGQLTFVTRGLVSMESEQGVWVVPQGQLAWVPPSVSHASRSRGPTEGWLVSMPAHIARSLPTRVSVLYASPLLLAALERVSTPQSDDVALNLMLRRVITHEIERTKAEPLGIALPTSPVLRAWAGRYMRAPRVTMTIATAATEVAMSRRSFTRHFELETGSTFSEWKRLVMTQHAIERLTIGDTVTTISFELGYENPSAFIAMFKGVRKSAPRQFVKELSASAHSG